MTKFKQVCKYIKDNAELSRKEVVDLISKETGIKSTTVNVYYSKYLKEGNKSSSKKSSKKTEDKMEIEFVAEKKTTKSKGFEITVDKKSKFIAIITVTHIDSGKSAFTSTDHKPSSIKEKVEDMKKRLTIHLED